MKFLVLSLMFLCLGLSEPAVLAFYSKPVTKKSVLELIEQAKKQGLETDIYVQTLASLEESKLEDESAYIEGVQTTYRNLQEHLHRKQLSKSRQWHIFADKFFSKVLEFKMIPPGRLSILGEITDEGAIEMLCLASKSKSKEADHVFLAKLFLLSEIAPLPVKDLDHVDFKLVYTDKEVCLHLYANNFDEPFLVAKRSYKPGSRLIPADPHPYRGFGLNAFPEVLGPGVMEDGMKNHFYGD